MFLFKQNSLLSLFLFSHLAQHRGYRLCLFTSCSSNHGFTRANSLSHEQLDVLSACSEGVKWRVWRHRVKQLREAPDQSVLHISSITFAFSPLILPEIFLVWAEFSLIFYHYVKTASFWKLRHFPLTWILCFWAKTRRSHYWVLYSLNYGLQWIVRN